MEAFTPVILYLSKQSSAKIINLFDNISKSDKKLCFRLKNSFMVVFSIIIYQKHIGDVVLDSALILNDRNSLQK
ncbi:hypothetical protein D7D25_08320 [Proteiniphilum sp. X52]|nr:hypothetical protein D7D25_08320 [Proteiniphilum sp. X52]